MLALLVQAFNGPVHRPDELGRGHLFKALGFTLRYVQVLEYLQHQLPALNGVLVPAGTHNPGHDDGLVEETVGLGYLAQHGNLGAAAGLAEDGDVLRVAAEVRYIVPHPAQGLHQVGHAHVHGVLVFLAEGGHIEIAEGVEPMVYGDHYHIVILCKVIAVVADLLYAGPRRVAAAVYPEHHGLLCRRVAARGPQVQVLAVFRAGPEAVGDHHLAHGLGLGKHRAVHAVAAGVLHALPRGHGLGHLEALCLGVAYAVEMVHALEVEAPKLAFGGLNDGRGFGETEIHFNQLLTFLCKTACAFIVYIKTPCLKSPNLYKSFNRQCAFYPGGYNYFGTN